MPGVRSSEVGCNLGTKLEALAGQGLVVKLEHRAVLRESLLLKEAESGLRPLVYWGKIEAVNGKDYHIATCTQGAFVLDGAQRATVKVCFSQDGLQWADLQPLGPGVAARAAGVTAPLSGDPATEYPLGSTALPPPPEEGEDEAAKPFVPPSKRVTELQRLRAIVDEVTAATGLAPSGSHTVDAKRRVVPNPLFSGLPRPDKLESYYHAKDGPGGRTLADDVQGLWALSYDPFTSRAVLTSLVWTGYSFFYDVSSHEWGGLYMGNGIRNDDLIFML